MRNSNSNGETRIDLFVRPGGRQLWSHHQSVIDRIEQLKAADTIDYHRLHFWPREVSLSGPMSDTPYHRAAVRAVEEFEKWVGSINREVTLHFEREHVESELTGESYDILRVPACCLALYEEDALVGVYPCHEYDEVVTVDDALTRLTDWLETDDESTRTPAPATSNSN